MTVLKNDENRNNDKTVGAVLSKGARILTDAGIENAKAEARYLMAQYRDTDIATLYSELYAQLDDFTAMRFMKAIKKRATHYPFQYILGFTYFLEYKFICREKVLIPRFDTENLVMHALEMSPAKGQNVLDMCTGSGCIGISYYLTRLKEGYKDNVTLSDISPDALRLAEDNARGNDADVTVVESDLFEAFKNEDGTPAVKFDMILSNPPYIRTKDIYNLIKDVRDFEPRLALDGEADGLGFYRRIIKEAPDFLTDEGVLIFEIGSEEYMDVQDMMLDAGFRDIKRLKDMSGLDRVVSGIYKER